MESPSSSVHREASSESSPSLDALVGHLLAAKRSLACVEHVSRANSLVTSTRTALELHTAYKARVSFLQTGCQAQTRVLHKIQSYTHDLVHESRVEHASVIKRLDVADERLKATLERLRDTIVEKSLRPSDEDPKSLADFVDETGVQALKDNINETLDSFDQAKQAFEAMAKSLNDDIARAEDLLERKPATDDTEVAGSYPSVVIPDILSRMEPNAEEMASNLESLVKHFDLCITAIKHTEGGGAAASKFTTDIPEGVRLQLEQSESLELIEPEERQEMLEVVQKDAGEVDEVVAEIKDKLAEMEVDFGRVEASMEFQSEDAKHTASALKLLDNVGFNLPKYTTQSQLFMIRWDEEKAKIEDHMAELEGLREFYAGFLDAYNNLIIEVGRRKDTEKRIEKIRRDAVARIDKLLTEETAERNHFRQAQGDFLPVDIWPGLMTSPPRHEFTVVEGTEDSLPDISASTITRAIRSLESEQRSTHAK